MEPIKFEDTKLLLFYERACNKALEEIRTMKIIPEPLRIYIEKDNLLHNTLGCELALFVFKNRVLLRRYWEHERTIKYNHLTLTNFKEMEKIAPKSVEQMKRNALNILSGPN